jgi:hypothetical protein
MPADDEAPAPKTAQEKLAEVVARRKSEAGQGGWSGASGKRQAERAASARSLSKSKPAMRK